jgi:hypothetical protein
MSSRLAPLRALLGRTRATLAVKPVRHMPPARSDFTGFLEVARVGARRSGASAPDGVRLALASSTTHGDTSGLMVMPRSAAQATVSAATVAQSKSAVLPRRSCSPWGAPGARHVLTGTRHRAHRARWYRAVRDRVGGSRSTAGVPRAHPPSSCHRATSGGIAIPRSLAHSTVSFAIESQSTAAVRAVIGCRVVSSQTSMCWISSGSAAYSLRRRS